VTSEPSNRRMTEAAHIRRATATDAYAIAAIVVRGWQAAYRGILPDDFLDGLSVGAREIAWRMRLESGTEGGAPAWVAELDATAIGFVASGPPRDEDVALPALEIYAIYVMPEAWRSGVGGALLTTAVDHWRESGVTALVLWVLEANSAGRAFYEAMGWQPDGIRQLIDLGGFTVAEVRYRLDHA